MKHKHEPLWSVCDAVKTDCDDVYAWTAAEAACRYVDWRDYVHRQRSSKRHVIVTDAYGDKRRYCVESNGQEYIAYEEQEG